MSYFIECLMGDLRASATGRITARLTFAEHDYLVAHNRVSVRCIRRNSGSSLLSIHLV